MLLNILGHTALCFPHHEEPCSPTCHSLKGGEHHDMWSCRFSSGAEVKGRGRGRKRSVPCPLWSATSEIHKETQLSELPPGSPLNSLIAQLGSLEQEVEALAVARGWGDDLWRHSGLYAEKSCWVPSERAFKVLGEFSKLVLLKTLSVVLGRYSLSCGSAWPCGTFWIVRRRQPVALVYFKVDLSTHTHTHIQKDIW